MARAQRHISPVGTVGFFAYPRAYEGDLIVRLRFEGEAAEAMQKEIDGIIAADGRDGIANPCKPEVDKESGDETGAMLVTFKCKAGGVRKDNGESWEKATKLIDTAKQNLTAKVGAGSQARVSFTVRPTEYKGKNYLQLQPAAVQITDLVEFGGDAADDFDDIDGFVGETPAAPVEGGSAPSTSEDF